MLVDQQSTSLLIREHPNETAVSRTFDYSDLTAFLLMVLGVTDSHPSTMSAPSFQDLVKKAREGDNIPVTLVGDIGVKDPFITLPESETLAKLIEIMASGVHRIAVTKDSTSKDVVGVLSQRKVIRFFWENVRAFTDIEGLYQKSVSLAFSIALIFARSANWVLDHPMLFASAPTPGPLLLSK
jgi:CBS domain